jgi:predicted transcriptional regulator
MDMKFSEALNATLEEFGLSAKTIAQESGIREATLSEFRRGKKEIHTDNLERLIRALPQEAKQYLFFKLLVVQMDKQGIATLLSAIAYHLKTENTENPHTHQPEAALSLR